MRRGRETRVRRGRETRVRCGGAHTPLSILVAVVAVSCFPRLATAGRKSEASLRFIPSCVMAFSTIRCSLAGADSCSGGLEGVARLWMAGGRRAERAASLETSSRDAMLCCMSRDQSEETPRSWEHGMMSCCWLRSELTKDFPLAHRRSLASLCLTAPLSSSIPADEEPCWFEIRDRETLQLRWSCDGTGGPWWCTPMTR